MPYLICTKMKQIMAICWAIAYVRQLESVLKKNWLMPLTEHLSIQDFIDRIPKHRLFPDGTTINIQEVGVYLLKYGVLLERECHLACPERVVGVIDPQDQRDRLRPLTLVVHYLHQYLYSYGNANAGFDQFHNDLKSLIQAGGLVSVQFLCYPSYSQSLGNGLFFPTEEEMGSPCPIDGHVTLAVGHAYDEKDKLYYLLQESMGAEFGYEGYTRIYANMIKAYVEMTV